MFSTINFHGVEFVECMGYVLMDNEWVSIDEVKEMENDMGWYFDNYQDWTYENPEPMMWGLSL